MLINASAFVFAFAFAFAFAFLHSHSHSHLHQIQLCRQVIYGNWSTEPVTVFTDDTSKTHITIFHFMPHPRDVVARAKRELEEGEVDEIVNNTTPEKRTNLLLACRIASIDTIKQIIANVVSVCDALWVSSEEPEKPPLMAREVGPNGH